mmetsp:Transcript_72816/g.197003  ORF Transcript_72816/g.197003 Transcript_72816/m.197003 type:complete len:296 (-) Transcript_72816:141-1028(-)
MLCSPVDQLLRVLVLPLFVFPIRPLRDVPLPLCLRLLQRTSQLPRDGPRDNNLALVVVRTGQMLGQVGDEAARGHGLPGEAVAQHVLAPVGLGIAVPVRISVQVRAAVRAGGAALKLHPQLLELLELVGHNVDRGLAPLDRALLLGQPRVVVVAVELGQLLRLLQPLHDEADPPFAVLGEELLHLSYLRRGEGAAGRGVGLGNGQLAAQLLGLAAKCRLDAVLVHSVRHRLRLHKFHLLAEFHGGERLVKINRAGGYGCHHHRLGVPTESLLEDMGELRVPEGRIAFLVASFREF